MRSSLEYIFAPFDTKTFFEDYWEKNFLHIKHNNPAYFAEVLSVDTIDDLLSKQNLKKEGIRLVNNGVEIHANSWTRTYKLINGTITEVVLPEKVLMHYHKGATIVISFADFMMPELATYKRLIEQQLGINLQANIYITPPNAQGFAKHYDTHDIFLFQIKGFKKWRIYDTGEELPTSFNPFNKEPVLIEQIEINAGDFLYMPRGIVHEAFSSDVSTIHVNFAFKPRYGFDLLSDLANFAENDDVFFRRIVPHAYCTKEEIDTYLNEFNEKFTQLISKYDIRKLLSKQKEHFVEKQLMDFTGRFADAIALETLNSDSVISRRTGFEYIVKENDKLTMISFGQQKVAIPKFVEKDIFLQDHPFKVSDIKGLITNDNKLTLVREFIKAGFLKIEQQ